MIKRFAIATNEAKNENNTEDIASTHGSQETFFSRPSPKAGRELHIDRMRENDGGRKP